MVDLAKQSLLSHYLSLTNHFINASRYYETICVVFTDDKNFWVIFNMTFNFIWTLEIFGKIEFLTRLITLMHIYIVRTVPIFYATFTVINTKVQRCFVKLSIEHSIKEYKIVPEWFLQNYIKGILRQGIAHCQTCPPLGLFGKIFANSTDLFGGA